MALKTIIHPFGTSPQIYEQYRNFMDELPFDFDDRSDNIYKKFLDGKGDAYVGIEVPSAAYPILHIKQTSGQERQERVSQTMNINLLSVAYDDDFICVMHQPNAVLPDISGYSQAALMGWYLCRAEFPEGGSTWVVGGIQHSSKSNDNSFATVLFHLDDSLDDLTNVSAGTSIPSRSTLRTGLLETTACTGRGTAIPTKKLSIITKTPEPYIGSVGWEEVGGKEYYKNGIFLIDAQR